MFVAIALTVVGVVWFVIAQLRPERPYTVLPPGVPEAAGAAEAAEAIPDEAGDGTGDVASGQVAAVSPVAAEPGEPDEARGTTPRSDG